MADDDRKRNADQGGPGTAVITKTKPQTKKPSLYRVLMLNDDYTPMEFVVHVLERFFSKDHEAATRIMLHVHHHGIGECGIYTYEVAETKVTQVMDFATKTSASSAMRDGKKVRVGGDGALNTNEDGNLMPTFSRSLEQSLHRALALANERHHEYATLEHLLLALIDDQDASAVMRACNVDLDKLKRSLTAYLESELENLITDGAEDSKPTAGFQRVIQRAVIHVQSSRPRGSHRRQCAGRDLRRAREPRRLFPARAGHDALRRGQLHQPRHRQAAGPVRVAPGARRRGRGRQPKAATSPRRRATRSTPIASTSTRRPRTARSIR